MCFHALVAPGGFSLWIRYGMGEPSTPSYFPICNIVPLNKSAPGESAISPVSQNPGVGGAATARCRKTTPQRGSPVAVVGRRACLELPPPLVFLFAQSLIAPKQSGIYCCCQPRWCMLS